MRQEATSPAENMQSTKSKTGIVASYNNKSDFNNLANASQAAKKCNLRSRLKRPVQNLPIAEVLSSSKVLEAIDNTSNNHIGDTQDLSYTINSSPDDGAIETLGNVEDGKQYLLEATYRIWHRNQIIADLIWKQEKNEDTREWELEIEITSQNHMLTDSVFQAIREQVNKEKKELEEESSDYHV